MKTFVLAGLLAVAGLGARAQGQANGTPSTPPSLLASAVVAGLVSAVVSGGIALLVKDKEYRNDFYKKVIDKRMRAIELIEPLSSAFTTAYNTKKGNKYHAYFSDNTDTNTGLNNMIDEASKYYFWLSIPTHNALGILVAAVISTRKESRAVANYEDKCEIAAKAYQSIKNARIALEHSIKQDMSTMHDVPRFLKPSP